jgi:hypothetical protein
LRTRQLTIWKDILIHHATFNTPFYLEPDSPVLSNPKIARKLQFFDTLKTYLLSQNLLFTLPTNKTLLLPRPLPELAAEVLRWAQQSSHLNVVETFAFLNSASEGFVFRGLPDEVFLEIFRLLERQGRAKLLPPSGFKILLASACCAHTN